MLLIRCFELINYASSKRIKILLSLLIKKWKFQVPCWKIKRGMDETVDENRANAITNVYKLI